MTCMGCEFGHYLAVDGQHEEPSYGNEVYHYPCTDVPRDAEGRPTMLAWGDGYVTPARVPVDSDETGGEG